jgi:hypothetical protein
MTMTAYWRNQFIALEKAKEEDMHPHAHFNAKLDFLKTAVGFDPMEDDYYYVLSQDDDEDGEFDFCDSYRRDAQHRARQNNLPERLFIRCGASTKKYGYPKVANYNWRVFDWHGSSKYLTASECNLFGFDYHYGEAPEGILFEKNIHSNVYKHAVKNHEMACKAIDSMKKHVDSELYAKFEAKWKSHWWHLYNTYLRSEEWQSISRRRIDFDGFTCTSCENHGGDIILQAHHTTYKNVGAENIADDLVTLCKDCHQQQHGRIFA